MVSCTCSFSSLVDQCFPCGTSSDYPTHVEVVTLREFWDIWNRTESVAIKPSTVNLSCCLLKQVSFSLFPLFCASLLNCSTALVRGPQALSYKYSLPLRPSFLKLHQGMHCIDQGVNKYVISFTRRTPTPFTPPSPRTNTVYIRVYLKRRQRRVQEVSSKKIFFSMEALKEWQKLQLTAAWRVSSLMMQGRFLVSASATILSSALKALQLGVPMQGRI